MVYKVNKTWVQLYMYGYIYVVSGYSKQTMHRKYCIIKMNTAVNLNIISSECTVYLFTKSITIIKE